MGAAMLLRSGKERKWPFDLHKKYKALVPGRMFSAAAQAEARASTSTDNEPKCFIKKLNNGMLVGTIETPSPVSRLAVVANAGSRFESGDNLGIAHLLRQSAKLRTENMSQLGIARKSLQLGSDVTCVGTRELIYYKSNVTRNCAGAMVEILQELTTKQVFKPWEVNDLQTNADALPLDLALYKTQPYIQCVELLHSAAFRNTLGRSLYAPDFMVGKYHSEQVAQYVKTYFSAGRMALVGVGIGHEELEELASQFETSGSAGVPAEKAAYHSGEVRHNSGGPLTYVAFAYGGPSQSDKDLLPAEVLKHIMGVGPHIKYSLGTATSQLAKAVSQSTDLPFAVSCLTANYSDGGLFGFTAVAPSSQVEKVVRSAANQFRGALTSGLSDADVSRAKTQLKAEICMQFENPDVLLNWLGEQTLHSDQILTPDEIYKMVDNVTTSDVNNVAKKIAGTKPTMASTGNTENVPYLDRIFS
ncbi:mitochondrial-processing peptidase subunit alpha [Plakobranchus ocellatus]|uniref:Mitochondrial-processing peptidase subunit alpha n=1 Tax=Plakobranchus ocellatus TaxID=259542 RepID=A0AAV4D267_9GAST|nr:mitochondrial-processing peptidase subunit alpha [Plakobranchus ocellatus]